MHRTVRDVMVAPALVVPESTPFKQIVELLDREGISAVPVVDGTGIVVGIVGEEDLLVKEERAIPLARRLRHPGLGHRETRKLRGLVARDVMTEPAVTIGPDASVAAAARLMAEHAVGRLPVVDAEGRPLGMVTRRDLLTVFLRPDADIRAEVRNRVIAHVFSIDPSTIPVQVIDGIVTLEGRVEHRSTIRLLGALVATVDGVVDVDVRTTFDVDDTTHLWAEAPWRAVTGQGVR
jgi:CBS domain-containing protein